MIRTTIRIRKDLLDQSRILALERGTNLQDVINDILAKGYGEISDLNRHKRAMTTIDSIRQTLSQHGQIDTEALLNESKRELK
ncbi:MAG TPA: hypothetical protein VF810_02175 [Patescibacteria group bacterium]